MRLLSIEVSLGVFTYKAGVAKGNKTEIVSLRKFLDHWDKQDNIPIQREMFKFLQLEIVNTS